MPYAICNEIVDNSRLPSLVSRQFVIHVTEWQDLVKNLKRLKT